MPKHEKKNRFLSESSSRSRSSSKSRSRSRSSSSSVSNKRHKKNRHSDKRHNNRNKDDHRRRSISKSRSRSSRSDSRKKGFRNKRYRRDEKSPSDPRNERDRYGKKEDKDGKKDDQPVIEPEKPCFIPSGILARFSNSVGDVVLKFTQPLDAATPDENWRIFSFKGTEALPVIHINKHSVYLLGKDPEVCDIHLENPTVSSQHAVIQFREVKKFLETGGSETKIKPYIMDLESTNGTFLNGEKLEPARYYELLVEDVLKFAHSSRDYVIMKDK